MDSVSYRPGAYIQQLKAEIQADPNAYEAQQLGEWTGEKRPSTAFKYESCSRKWRLLKAVVSVIIFPIGIAHLIHGLVGKFVFVGWINGTKALRDFYFVTALQGKEQENFRMGAYLETNAYIADNRHDLVVKRERGEVDGKRVDFYLYGRRDTIENGVWTMVTRGNGDCMERIEEFKLPAGDSQATNYLFYNYAGVGKSQGLPTKKLAINTHKAVMNFLENPEKIGARRIVEYDRSIGAGVAGEAYVDYEFRAGVEHEFVKDRTFSKLSDVFWFTPLLKLVGWELDSMASSERLESLGKREWIIQGAVEATNTLEADQIRGDGLMGITNTAAHALLTKRTDWKHKHFIGISQHSGHYNNALRRVKDLAVRLGIKSPTPPEPAQVAPSMWQSVSKRVTRFFVGKAAEAA